MTEPTDAERDQFEEMMRLETFDDLSRLGDGSYTSYEARVGWIAWQAARRTAAPVGAACQHEWDGFVRTSMPPKYACRKCHAFFDSPPTTTQQPTQAQAGAVPLTDEQISNLWDGHTVPVFGKTGINPFVFARALEAAHGIKGGQHGTS